MSLSLVGLGLYDALDITLRGLELVKKADIVYLEHYTALSHNKEDLEKAYGKSIKYATRAFVEDGTTILAQAKTHHVVILVVGDIFSATTHADLYLRATQNSIPVNCVYNASILTAVAKTGLQLYKFGKTTSLVFFEPSWKPASAYHAIKQNREAGLHTLVLLDIKVAESKKDDLLKDVHRPLPARCMTIPQAIEQLFELEKLYGEQVFVPTTPCVGVARLGCASERIVFATAKDMQQVDFGEPMHSLIVPGALHFHEEEMLELYKKK
jgi:diphthine synthase